VNKEVSSEKEVMGGDEVIAGGKETLGGGLGGIKNIIHFQQPYKNLMSVP